MESAKIQHILWDWNGTLVDDAPFSWRIFNSLATSRGLSAVTFEFYQSIYGHPIEDMYNKAGFDFSVETFADVAKEWHRLYVQGLPEVALHFDAISVLEHFKALGKYQSVLSALPQDVLSGSVQRHDIGDFFLEVCGLEDLHGRSKIDNAHDLLKRLNAPATSTLIVGDSTHDAEVARALGAHCILVSRGYEDHARLRQHGFPVVGSLDAVVEHMIGHPHAL